MKHLKKHQTISSSIASNSTYLDEIKQQEHSKFSLLSLNLDSFCKSKLSSFCENVRDINEILNTKLVDFFLLQETKLDDSIPISFFRNSMYKSFRCDRDGSGGGSLLFIKKEYKIIKIQTISDVCDLEFILVRLKINKRIVNFICVYKPPIDNEEVFIEKIELLLLSIDPEEPLVILGDLNMNQLENNQNKTLSRFLSNNNFTNWIKTPTRVVTKLYTAQNNLKTASSSLDVIISNLDFVKHTSTIDCPFSDHKFIFGSLDITKLKSIPIKITTRKLNDDNILLINNQIHNTDFSKFDSIKNVDFRWLEIKSELISLVDNIAPLRDIQLRDRDQSPWFDDTLLECKYQRDSAYKNFFNSKSDFDYLVYVNARRDYQKLLNSKMIEYFKEKSTKDFKSSKKFWEFYSTQIKIRSDKSSSSYPSLISNGNISASNSTDISNMFNCFFSSLSSESNASIDDCFEFSSNHLSKMIDAKIINPTTFKFSKTTAIIVSKAIDSIANQSGPGVSGIATKILKQYSPNLLNTITQLFNDCISTGNIPLEWKSAILTPLFKGKKLDPSDVNNYRGISVLPPLTKVFEKILATQVVTYFNINNLFYPSQHGFRSAHSCESALHEIISEMNTIRSKRHIGLYLFIDFKKAFDLVDSRLLIAKLKHYGFDESSLRLISGYFSDRKQYVKFNGATSTASDIKLGVVQGSCLGPLLFNIFINDLPYFLNELITRMFADDTTVSASDTDYTKLLVKFNKSIELLLIWCRFNKIDINWLKTEIMFISKK